MSDVCIVCHGKGCALCYGENSHKSHQKYPGIGGLAEWGAERMRYIATIDRLDRIERILDEQFGPKVVAAYSRQEAGEK